MKTSAFRENLNRQIEQEREKNKKLLNRTGQLEKQIKVLVEDSVVLLKARMAELGINTSSQNDLLCKAKEIVGKHKELQQAANKIQNEVQALEDEQSKYVNFHVKKLAEKNQQNPMDFESASKTSLNLVLKEIDNTFNQRQKLKNHISSLEAEVVNIERNSEDIKIKTELAAAKNSNSQTTASIYAVSNVTPQPTFKQTHVATAKTSRKNRDHRAKSNDWPDVPDVDKIEEKNPELLAQKILETGRQIEAGRLLANNQYKAKNEPFYATQQKKSAANAGNSSQQQMMAQLMNAPHAHNSKASKLQQSVMATMIPVKIPLTIDAVESSPKMVNFEDRLKSIITTALQEKGQEQTSSTPASTIQHALHTAHTNKKLQSTSPKKALSVNYPPGSSSNWNIGSTQAILSVVKPSLTISPSQISPNKARHAHITDYPAELNYGLKVRPEHMPNFAKSMASIHPNDLSKMMYDSQAQAQAQANYQQQLIQSQIQQQQLYMPARDHQMIFSRAVEEKREFKTPDNIRYERQVDLGRSSVGSIENEFITNSNSNSGKPSGQMQQRSSSSLSQPDYTQVSPAKLALRRHLSQEKLQSSTVPCKTIGDMINGEIHRVMEISQQSIINATINNSTQPGTSGASGSSNSMRHVENVLERETENQISPYSMSKLTKQPQFLPEHYQSNMLDQHNRNISNIRTVKVPQHISPHAPHAQKFAPHTMSIIHHSDARRSQSPDQHQLYMAMHHKSERDPTQQLSHLHHSRSEEKKVRTTEPPLEGKLFCFKDCLNNDLINNYRK